MKKIELHSTDYVRLLNGELADDIDTIYAEESLNEILAEMAVNNQFLVDGESYKRMTELTQEQQQLYIDHLTKEQQYEDYLTILNFDYPNEHIKGWMNSDNYSNNYIKGWDSLMDVAKKVVTVLTITKSKNAVELISDRIMEFDLVGVYDELIKQIKIINAAFKYADDTVNNDYVINNNVEDINIFKGNESEFIEFMKIILIENEDFDYSILGISDAIEYIENYCGNLDLIE